MLKNKQLYYEIVDDGQTQADEARGDSGDKLPAESKDDVTPTRDPYCELTAAADKIKRARFRVIPDNKNRVVALTMVVFAIVLAGCILLRLSKNKVGSIVICAIMLVGVAVAVVAGLVHSAQSRKVYFCYYFKTEFGCVCISYVGSNATVFISSDKAYRMELDGDNFYTLSPDAYMDYLDGEGAGIVSVLEAKESDVEIVEESVDGYVYRVKNKVGGEHNVFVSDGNIVSIVSDQPTKTDEIDGKTGEAKIKLERFEKTDMTDDFTVQLPDYVKQTFCRFGFDIDELLSRL